MIRIKIEESFDKQWNQRLLNSITGSIYQTKEYSEFIQHKGWFPRFLKFIDNDENIVGQILLSTYSRFQKKRGSKIINFVPCIKKSIYRWVFGPVIFDLSKSKEIYKCLAEFLNSQNCKVYGSEHPLIPNSFQHLDSSFHLENWSTFLIDLKTSSDLLFKKFDKHSARKNIERSEKRGVTINEINENNLFEYYELLKETKSKVDWNVTFDEILYLWKKLKPIGFTGFLAKHEEIPVGGILISYFNNYINEWGVGRSKLDYTKKLYSQDLLKWHIINWGIKNNHNFYDLTGANPNPSSEKESVIFRYKKKWAGKYVEYNICKI
jgi:lipid II:glycine glycyltransferase (peptidoglycan interpeptide bridge formation enzyme)